jgi:hypothetical protein
MSLQRSQSPVPGAPGSPTYAQVAGSSPPSPNAAGSKRVRKPTKLADGSYVPPIKKTKIVADLSAPVPSTSTPAPIVTSAPTHAPTRSQHAPRTHPNIPANNSGDESSGGTDSDSSEDAFQPRSGSDHDSVTSVLDLDAVPSDDENVVEVSAAGRSKEKSKGKKKKSKGKKAKGKAKAQLRAAIAAVPDAEKEPETDEAELGAYPKATYCVLVMTSPS